MSKFLSQLKKWINRMGFKTWVILYIISSAIILVLKTEFVPLQLIYWEQFNGINFIFTYVQFSSWEIWDEHGKLQQAESNGIVIHKNTDAYQLLQFTVCVMSPTHPHLVLQLLVQIQITLLPLLHDSSRTSSLLMSNFTTKLHGFSRQSDIFIVVFM